MNGIMKTFKSFEESGLLIKSVSKLKTKQNNKKEGF